MNYLLSRKTILLGFVFLTFSSIHFAVAQSNNANDAMLNKLTPAEIKKAGNYCSMVPPLPVGKHTTERIWPLAGV